MEKTHLGIIRNKTFASSSFFNINARSALSGLMFYLTSGINLPDERRKCNYQVLQLEFILF